MNLLLDSQAFIWTHNEPHKLSNKVAMEILNPANTLFLSMASVWEIQIKIQIKKFKFKDPLADVIAEQQKVNSLRILPIILAHVLELEKLPFHHKDPFDRLIIAQAIVENLMIASSDAAFDLYGIERIW